MVKLAWEAYPQGFAAIILLNLVQGLVPLGSAWLSKILFDLLAQALQSNGQPPSPWDFLSPLAAYTILTIGAQTMTPLNSFLEADLERKLTLNVHTMVYGKINDFLGLAPFEDSHFYDTLRLAAQGAQMGPTQTVRLFKMILQSSITIAAFLGILLSFNLFLTGVVLVAVLPQMYVQMKMSRQRFGLASDNSPKERRASYFGFILSSVQHAKEVRLFNLGQHFLDAFRMAYQEIHRTQRSQQVSELRWHVALTALNSTISAGAFVVVLLQAFDRKLSLGDVILYTSAVRSLQDALYSFMMSFSGLSENTLFFMRYTQLMALPQPLPLATPIQPVPKLLHGIEFRDVSFRYSDQHPWILRKVNLLLPAGRSVALVGLNGAGKTTLVKLLTRLYDPVEGQVLWDGIDIRMFDPVELRSHCAVILQDFIHYDLTVRENIGLGSVSQIENTSQVHNSAIRAGIHSTIETLPHGYETILSRWLTDSNFGTDLSGGEWQKIAIARMLMREAELLILDEPTSALDAQAEHDLYSSFVEMVAGRTSLLITHRFSTTRMADLIVVLQDGRIVESGTHQTLLLCGGTYAKLYQMQAERYQ